MSSTETALQRRQRLSSAMDAKRAEPAIGPSGVSVRRQALARARAAAEEEEFGVSRNSRRSQSVQRGGRGSSTELISDLRLQLSASQQQAKEANARVQLLQQSSGELQEELRRTREERDVLRAELVGRCTSQRSTLSKEEMEEQLKSVNVAYESVQRQRREDEARYASMAAARDAAQQELCSIQQQMQHEPGSPLVSPKNADGELEALRAKLKKKNAALLDAQQEIMRAREQLEEIEDSSQREAVPAAPPAVDELAALDKQEPHALRERVQRLNQELMEAQLQVLQLKARVVEHKEKAVSAQSEALEHWRQEEARMGAELAGLQHEVEMERSTGAAESEDKHALKEKVHQVNAELMQTQLELLELQRRAAPKPETLPEPQTEVAEGCSQELLELKARLEQLEPVAAHAGKLKARLAKVQKELLASQTNLLLANERLEELGETVE